MNEKYDEGDIIRQTTVKVDPDDTPETLAAKVQIAEKKQLVEVLIEMAEHRRIL